MQDCTRCTTVLSPGRKLITLFVELEFETESIDYYKISQGLCTISAIPFSLSFLLSVTQVFTIFPQFSTLEITSIKEALNTINNSILHFKVFEIARYRILDFNGKEKCNFSKVVVGHRGSS